MAFGRLEDDTGNIEIVVFPRAYSANPDIWQKDQLVVIRGKLKAESEANTIMVDNGVTLAEAITANTNNFVISLDLSSIDDKMAAINKAKAFLKKHPGRDRLIIDVKYNGGGRAITIPFGVKYSRQLEAELAKTI